MTEAGTVRLVKVVAKSRPVCQQPAAIPLFCLFLLSLGLRVIYIIFLLILYNRFHDQIDFMNTW